MNARDERPRALTALFAGSRGHWARIFSLDLVGPLPLRTFNPVTLAGKLSLVKRRWRSRVSQ